MGGAQSATELGRIEDVLRAQWLRLRPWVHGLEEDARELPSVLGGWTVEDLVAHLGRAMDALTHARPSAPGTVPLTLGEYVGSYPERAVEIAATTRELAAEIRDDPLPAVDRRVEAALAQLAVLRDLGPDPVVQARRGPILLSEMVLSRLIELVVHADDLARSTHRDGPGPVLPEALALVADALLEIAVDRGGWNLEIVDPIAWVRLACGRVPLTVDALAAALQPTYASDSLPDLGTVLPLL
ncbi:maleylpyruvate isomerase N-terminal domain-containing protein [Cellulomonas sp. KRMCY2]|uniref:maleylpyruvate isomerase N-terminal domain-containing protein n=1 Tax=Cellulomonas sp. KRMCY2 TaxID=1304865 RepID=UPI00045E94CA|nr:maleylpyruvate isomerase N-terminal domain-containing protein [Cellulomonas sp. KRMCY2]